MQKMNKFLAKEKSRYLIIFRIDRQFYALPLDDVVRVIRMVAISPIPDMPNSILGIINMAGQIIPVIDLRFLFGQVNKPPELQDLLLVIQAQGQIFSVIVDEVLNILELPLNQIQSPPAAISQSRFLAAAVRQDDMLILVLDALRLLPKNIGET